MFLQSRPRRKRSVRPDLLSLEGRQLLNAAMPHHPHDAKVSAEVFDAKKNYYKKYGKNSGPSVTMIEHVMSGGYLFTNFEAPGAGTVAPFGTFANGIANSGTAVGFATDNSGNDHNFTVNLFKNSYVTELNINGSMNANANGVNSSGTVVGTDGKGNAFIETKGKVKTFIPLGGTSAVAFGINDRGTVVGQFTTGSKTPGFIRVTKNKYIEINAPSGPNTVNAQSINNNGLVVGFYVGTDGQDHGFMASEKSADHGVITGTPIADPTIPNVAGEPGATFVFSQVLGINDHGIAVGYYGDSTTSQHGFIYNTNTGRYTFLDDPSEAFDNGVEVTQITGINNADQITGFYTDANGVAHGFVAQA